MVYINYMQQFSGAAAGGATAASKAAAKAGIGGPFVPVGGARGAQKARRSASGARRSRASVGGSAGELASDSAKGHWQNEGGVNVGAGRRTLHAAWRSNVLSCTLRSPLPSCPPPGAMPTWRRSPLPIAVIFAPQVYYDAKGRRLVGQRAYVASKRESGQLGQPGARKRKAQTGKRRQGSSRGGGGGGKRSRSKT